MTFPTGTVTFLFTDIEGSTKLWEAHPEAMQIALARHDALMREAIEAQDGYASGMPSAPPLPLPPAHLQQHWLPSLPSPENPGQRES